MRYLVTGGCGFLGSNVASHVLALKEELFVIDNFFRVGSRQNHTWLQGVGEFKFFEDDLRDQDRVAAIIRDVKPDYIFHFAGQVAMTTSLASPDLDFGINVIGGINVLEAVRKFSPNTTILFSSTNKVYGELRDVVFEEQTTRYVTPQYPNGFDESLPLDFQSPYGCSKGCIDQYMLDYCRSFNISTVVFRHSSIFGGQQFPTFDQGWIGWFILKALEAKDRAEAFTISGDGKQVRDVLFADDLINCYFSCIAHLDRARGQAFNIGGGVENSLSLLELFALLENELAVKLVYEKLPWRHSDQKVFIANTGKAAQAFAWSPKIDKVSGIKKMILWLKENAKPSGTERSNSGLSRGRESQNLTAASR